MSTTSWGTLTSGCGLNLWVAYMAVKTEEYIRCSRLISQYYSRKWFVQNAPDCDWTPRRVRLGLGVPECTIAEKVFERPYESQGLATLGLVHLGLQAFTS